MEEIIEKHQLIHTMFPPIVVTLLLPMMLLNVIQLNDVMLNKKNVQQRNVFTEQKRNDNTVFDTKQNKISVVYFQRQGWELINPKSTFKPNFFSHIH